MNQTTFTTSYDDMGYSGLEKSISCVVLKYSSQPVFIDCVVRDFPHTLLCDLYFSFIVRLLAFALLSIFEGNLKNIYWRAY